MGNFGRPPDERVLLQIVFQSEFHPRLIHRMPRSLKLFAPLFAFNETRAPRATFQIRQQIFNESRTRRRAAVIFFNKKARELRRTWYTTQWAADAAQSRADAHSAETIFTSAISILSHAANQIWSIRMWLRNLPPPPREAKQWMIHLSLKWAPGRAPRLRNALFSLAYACTACVRLVFFIHWAT